MALLILMAGFVKTWSEMVAGLLAEMTKGNVRVAKAGRLEGGHLTALGVEGWQQLKVEEIEGWFEEVEEY